MKVPEVGAWTSRNDWHRFRLTPYDEAIIRPAVQDEEFDPPMHEYGPYVLIEPRRTRQVHTTLDRAKARVERLYSLTCAIGKAHAQRSA